jgi:Protein of unknown function (DUF998)
MAPAALRGGVLGPILFAGATLLQDVTRPGFDPLRQFVSVLSLGDGGWLQAGNFIVSGALITAFGLELARRSLRATARLGPVRPGRLRVVPPRPARVRLGRVRLGLLRLGRVRPPAAQLGAALVAIAGLGLVLSGLFPTDPQWGYPVWISPEAAANPTLHARVHDLGGVLLAAGLPLAIVIAGARAVRDGSPRLAVHAAASVGVMAAAFLVGLFLGGPEAHFAWGGLLQRIALVAGLQWLVVRALTELASDASLHDVAPDGVTPLGAGPTWRDSAPGGVTQLGAGPTWRDAAAGGGTQLGARPTWRDAAADGGTQLGAARPGATPPRVAQRTDHRVAPA